MSKWQPLIGVTSDYHKGGDIFKGPAYFIGENYISAVREAGGIPVILPYSSDAKVIEKLAERIDGLLITGGNFDINPVFYGEDIIDKIGELNNKRTSFEMEIARIALRTDMSVLGICGGEQLLNVAGGGSLYQDIEVQVKGASNHQQKMPKSETHHSVIIEPDTKLYSILECETLEVNSTHHQSIKEVGKGFVFNAKAPDGIIEGIESESHRFVLGVQWHPEALYQKEERFKRLFETFIKSCKKRS
ncbi:MAG: gamma-glutamyl-gamma-aminobutyrate hydrolase family protein [Thermodesulfobacteriota bacterium]